MNGNQIKQFRMRNNITLRELSEKTKYTIPYLSYLENVKKYDELSERCSLIMENFFKDIINKN